MKTHFFTFLTFGCFLATFGTSVYGQDAERLFSRLDQNADGVIDQDEMPEQAKKRILNRDSDGDGKVSRDEMLAAMESDKGEPRKRNPESAKKSGQADPDRFKQLLKRLDKNGDGVLELSELPEQMSQRLSKLDKDGDKKITQEEMKVAGAKGKAAGGPEGKPGKDRFAAMFDRLPKNNDGLVDLESIEEENLVNRLRKLDSNGDNLLDKKELEALKAKMQKDMPGNPKKGKGDRKADRGSERSPQLPKRPSDDESGEGSGNDSNEGGRG